MDLAIFSGKPVFSQPVYVGAPAVEKVVQETYHQYMQDVFKRNYYTNNGPLVQNLEAEIAKLHGAKHCIATCNATVAQIILLKALELTGEIILPSFTFVATAHSCLWQNLTPVFCDISQETLMIDVAQAEKLITSKTCAIIGVHLFGNTADVEQLERLCAQYEVELIFDAAHAFGCTIGDTPVGGGGRAEFLSFHATKFFSTFEGGAILTNDDMLAERARLLRNFGFQGYDDVGFLGINGKMPEASAAMGLASIPEIENRRERFERNYEQYRSLLSHVPGVSVLKVGAQGKSNFQYVVLFIDEQVFGVSRDILCDVLWKENIIARKYFFPGCHRMAPYNTLYPDAYTWLPITESVSQSVLCLPANLPDGDADINKVITIINTVHDNSLEVIKWALTLQQK